MSAEMTELVQKTISQIVSATQYLDQYKDRREEAMHALIRTFLIREEHQLAVFASIPLDWEHRCSEWGCDPTKMALLEAWMYEEVEKLCV